MTKKKTDGKFLEMANKQFGEGTIFTLDEDFKIEVTPVSTGVSSMDHAAGIGGLPLGRIVEIFGGECIFYLA